VALSELDFEFRTVYDFVQKAKSRKKRLRPSTCPRYVYNTLATIKGKNHNLCCQNSDGFENITSTTLRISSTLLMPLPVFDPGPAEYDAPGVTYLTPEDQEALPYRITNILPWNHFGRKNVGYLYAVHHGAKVRETCGGKE